MSSSSSRISCMPIGPRAARRSPAFPRRCARACPAAHNAGCACCAGDPQLHEEHARIFRDSQQHLAQVLGLRGLFRHQIELLDLGKALDQRRDIRAEAALDIRAGGLGILDRVVEHRGGDGLVIHAQFGQDRRDFEGVREIGITRARFCEPCAFMA